MNDQEDIGTIQDFLSHGGTLHALANIKPSDLEIVYTYACQIFYSGKYSEAKPLFLILARLSHWQFEYWVALGLCHQRLSEHDQAQLCFGQAGLLRMDDPNIPYMAGLSYYLSGNKTMANKAFAVALKLCSAKQEYAYLKLEICRRQSLLIGEYHEQ